MQNTTHTTTDFLQELANAIDIIPQGRCDCVCCWALQRECDGLLHCRDCGRYVAVEIPRSFACQG